MKIVRVSAYELNLSCPHVAKVGLEVGDDVELVKKIVKKVKSTYKRSCYSKSRTRELQTISILLVQPAEAGADGITAINTIRAMAIDVETTETHS